MIIGVVSDPYLRRALVNAAHPEEDVILDKERRQAAVEWGFPRLVVWSAGASDPLVEHADLPTLTLTPELLGGWDAERRASELPPDRVDHLTGHLRRLIDKSASEPSWVDRALADLSRAAGLPLPPPLRAFGRRILEFPSHYSDLHPMADMCGVTRGALKARFRRRGLASPYVYLRWFRMIAVAYVLSDRSVTVANAAHQLGFTSDGNLCRAMLQLTRQTPTEARTLHGWNRLLISFAWKHLTAGALSGWVDLEELFEQRVA